MLRPVQLSSRTQKVLPIDACLAKTVKLADGNTTKGITVSTHCQIVGHVAIELIRRQPQWLQESLYPKGSELIAAAHDLGKVSPNFQEKIYSAAGESKEIGKAELDNTLGVHATISQACVQGIASKFIHEILGRHHGSSSSNVGLQIDEIYGGPEWQQNRLNLLAELKNRFACDWPTIRDANQANVLSGLTCVADWIGSGSLFDGVHPDGEPDTTPWK